jgi:hypothetical protein
MQLVARGARSARHPEQGPLPQELHDDHRPAHLHAVRGRLAQGRLGPLAPGRHLRARAPARRAARSGGALYEVSYLADRAARARWEAEAYRSNLELQFWRTGTTPSAQRTASVLKDYGCRDEDIEVTAKSLALSALSVKKGAVINEATHVALGWLDEHVPRLRFKQG